MGQVILMQREEESALSDEDILNLLLGVIRLVKKHGSVLQQSVFLEKIKELLHGE